MEIDNIIPMPGPADSWKLETEKIAQVLAEDMGERIKLTLVGDQGGRIERVFPTRSAYAALRRAAYAAGYAPTRGEKPSQIVAAITGRVLQEHPWPN